jgi:hypothetical protein
METGNHCIYNVSRDVLISEHVTEVGEGSNPLQFLTLLLNGPGISRDASLWWRRLSSERSWPPRLFAFDVAYLDAEGRIVESGSVGPGTDFPPMKESATSVLFLPDGRLSQTGSTRGNVVRICAKAELAARIGPASYSSSTPGETNMQAQPPQNQSGDPSSIEDTRLTGFAFDPFIGSLVHLPDPARPRAYGTEYFLTREPSPSDVQETFLGQEAEGAIAEPVPFESSGARELQTAEEATMQPEAQAAPGLEEAIQLIREQARRETESLKESRKKKTQTQGEKKISANNWPRRGEKRAIRTEQTTRPLEPFAEIPSEIGENQPQISQPENALTEPQAVVPSTSWNQIEEAQDPFGLEAATDWIMPESSSEEEPENEIETPEKMRRRPERKDRLTFARRLTHWIVGAVTTPRRRSKRIFVPGLVAFYWTGGAPRPHEVINISKSGLYLRTNDLWLPDTLVRMTLEKPIPYRRNKNESIGVLVRVVRIGSDGVGHEFITTEDLRRIRTPHVLPERGTSTRELENFLALR